VTLATFADQVVLVTGSSRGIGAALAAWLCAAGRARGHQSLGRCRQRRQDRQRRSRNRAARRFVIEADVSDATQVEALVVQVLAQWGQIDVLVCNAGICPFYDFLTMPEAVWDRVLDVNLKGVFSQGRWSPDTWSSAAQGGRIVAISSISSLVGGVQQAHYCASKAGINLLIKSMALNLAPYGITCNAVLPGTVETDINRQALSDAALRARLESGTPLGRLGQPDDIVGATLFLASDAARWVTGSLLVVDGGTTSTLQ
jgi:L-rhamnose 1-dehydrogenase